MISILGLRSSGKKFWTRERDPLVEQTLSFVKGMTAAKLAEFVQPLDPPATKLLPQPADSDFMAAERADFQRRILEFRAQQQKIRQRREEHYDLVWQKTCVTLGNATGASAL